MIAPAQQEPLSASTDPLPIAPDAQGTQTLSLITHQAEAEALAALLAEWFDEEDVAISAFEIEDPAALPTAFRKPGREGAMGTLHIAADALWQLEVHFAEPVAEADLRTHIAEAGFPQAANALTFTRLAAQDWISAALEGLDPVQAGRFVVHGAHDRDKIAPHQIGIEIEAALAFGTGHHGTTRGCLTLFDALLKRARPRAIADIGTGTGVLAIAAARALKCRIHAGEIDPDSVHIARANARLNAVACFVNPVEAAGLQHRTLQAGAPYDLVFANILARPLKAIAPQIGRASHARTQLILSGLLPPDVPSVLARYRAFGFTLRRRLLAEGWVSLLLARGRH